MAGNLVSLLLFQSTRSTGREKASARQAASQFLFPVSFSAHREDKFSAPGNGWQQSRNPDGSERHNDLHFTPAEKEEARRKHGSTQ